MRTAIITIGTELVDGRIVDTNTGFIARELERRGLRVVLALSLPDDDAAISKGLSYALGRDIGLLIITGGLGPTQDDITAWAIARALELELELNIEAVAMVADAVGSRADGLESHQIKQAMLPAGARPITPAGTAPGFIISHKGVPVVVLPGVPWELESLWEEALAASEVAPVLLAASAAPARRVICLYETGEPAIAAAVKSVLGKDQAGIEVSICSRFQEVVLELAYLPEAESLVEALLADLRECFAGQVYSEGEAIEAVIGAELGRRGKSLAVGESCTGGMLGQVITGVSGASQFFRGGVIAYDNEAKRSLLKVRRETLDSFGAVSEAVAQQLAIGARFACGADYGIGVTGIAGPAGGTAEKPVGLVFICVSSEPGDLVRGFSFRGGRDEVRHASVTAALHLLHNKLQADAALT
jgi:nicotinamide-nucleotide amidase